MMIFERAANCFARAVRPANSALSGEKLTPNLAKGKGENGISFPSWSCPSSCP